MFKLLLLLVGVTAAAAAAAGDPAGSGTVTVIQTTSIGKSLDLDSQTFCSLALSTDLCGLELLQSPGRLLTLLFLLLTSQQELPWLPLALFRPARLPLSVVPPAPRPLS